MRRDFSASHYPQPGAQRNDAHMTRAGPVHAVLFDLDGTLVDTETHTDRAIEVVVAKYGVRGFSLPHTETRGRTWSYIADVIRTESKIDVPATVLTGELLKLWDEATADANPVPGAPEALRAAAACKLKIAVVSSSPLAVIQRLIVRLGAKDLVDAHACVGGDGVRKGKPDPEGFLKSARSLGVDPDQTLVCEDSHAGLLAARAAGMRSLFIMCCAADIPGNSALATFSCMNYRTLPPMFWEQLASGSEDFAGRAFT
jgi:beta-phosphoglucomutase-like phosphatase (HAD superfamily)